MEFKTFCNICFTKKNIKKIEDSNKILYILISLIGNTEIINKSDLYLCSKCSKKLIEYDEFREKCFTNFVFFRKIYYEQEHKLETLKVENLKEKMKDFLCNCIVNENNNDLLKTLREFNYEENDFRNEVLLNTRFVENVSDLSQLTNDGDINEYEDNFNTNFEHNTEEKEFSGDVVSTSNEVYGFSNEELEDVKLHTEIDLGITVINSQDGEATENINRYKDFFAVPTFLTMAEKSKKYECSICKKRYEYSYDLKVHNRIHTGEKPYTCTICNKSFSQRKQVREHEVIHKGIKSHECDLCEKKFFRAQNLKAHYRVHTGEKRFLCIICNMRFACSSTLKNHRMKHFTEEILDLSVS